MIGVTFHQFHQALWNAMESLLFAVSVGESGEAGLEPRGEDTFIACEAGLTV